MSRIELKKLLCGAVAIISLATANGCGSDTAPVVVGSQDELTQYLNEHPELKDAPEDVINTNGI